MTKVLQCPCGFSVRESSDDALVEAAQVHARTAHGFDLKREQALAMAKPELPAKK
jgi:predicted small metal-binding protein